VELPANHLTKPEINALYFATHHQLWSFDAMASFRKCSFAAGEVVVQRPICSESDRF
jgi:hypothetical protein